MSIQSYAAPEAGAPFEKFSYAPGPLGPHESEIQVEYCGICHSDLSMVDNDWGMTSYPFVGGHEIIGRVAAVGDHVSHLRVGDRVGIGWNANSCMTCEWCTGGDHNLCRSGQGVIVGHHGGFADRVRADAAWVFPVPSEMNPATVGPLLCGGITVFNPMIQFNVRPTDRVGVIGIGGLGHMALLFLSAYGCDVTAFSSSPEKEGEARSFGAHHFINSRESDQLASVAGSLDYIISTVNVTLDWAAYLNALRPKGRLHMVGAALEPMQIPAFSLIGGQKSISGSPIGSPETTLQMLAFAARHGIEPTTELYQMSDINSAFDRLRSGEARYRLVLQNDFQDS